MSPYEIIQPGGSVEHWNDEAGSVWMAPAARPMAPQRLAQPGAARRIGTARSRSACCGNSMEDRMFPLTPAGLDEMTRALSR